MRIQLESRGRAWPALEKNFSSAGSCPNGAHRSKVPGRQFVRYEAGRCFQSRSRGLGVCRSCHVSTLVKQPGVSPLLLHLVPGAFGLKEDCPSVAGKDAEGTREMTGCI